MEGLKGMAMKGYVIGVAVSIVILVTVASSPYYQAWREEQRSMTERAEIMKEVTAGLSEYMYKVSVRKRLGLDFAPNGKPWPDFATHLDGYPVNHAGGLSSILVKNMSSADVFLKVYKIEGEVEVVSRHVFVPSHAIFSMNGFVSGEYLVRYLSLSSGRVFQERGIALEELKSNLGVKVSEFSMAIGDSPALTSSVVEVSADSF